MRNTSVECFWLHPGSKVMLYSGESSLLMSAVVIWYRAVEGRTQSACPCSNTRSHTQWHPQGLSLVLMQSSITEPRTWSMHSPFFSLHAFWMACVRAAECGQKAHNKPVQSWELTRRTSTRQKQTQILFNGLLKGRPSWVFMMLSATEM